MPTYYLDYENGSDAADGSSWANAWKTITTGATAARIAPGDIIRIAKSPAPYSIGSATWTDLSKTVTLAGAANATIENCEAAWTANGSGDSTVALTGVATQAKEGSYCMKITLDSSVQTSIMQAYYDIYTHDTTVHDLSAYQKISFWIYNSSAIVADNWTITLCSDTAGTTPVDTFAIPAIPSTSRWVPLTIARNGGGNLGSTIKSIAINTGSVAPTASSYVYIDNFIACTTSGLNLQSLISKNSAEQGGTETWYGIQSIVGATVLLDTGPDTKSNAGEGYSGTTESVTTYARETIKTIILASSAPAIQEVMDSGTLAAGNIQFQGGYNTANSNQDGETFFDGLNGQNHGIMLSGREYITLNRLNTYRYYRGIYFTGSKNCTITTTIANNNSYYGLGLTNFSNNNRFATIVANNNNNRGCDIDNSNINILTTVTTNNNQLGISFASATNNIAETITANNSTLYGILFNASSHNTVMTLSTKDNTSSGIGAYSGWNTINSATIAESTKVSGFWAHSDGKVFIQTISGYANIWCDYGNIVAQAATAGGTGNEWKMSVTNTARASNYPLKLKLAEIAVGANTQVTVTCYFKKSHATDIAAKLVTPGGELAGVSETSTTAPSDTTRNQLTLQFTPTAAGIVSIEAWAWWVANTADENVIIDDIAISQA